MLALEFLNFPQDKYKRQLAQSEGRATDPESRSREGGAQNRGLNQLSCPFLPDKAL